MGRKEAYDEDKMLTAIIKFADTYDGKIKYTDLARYADCNIKGLQGIQPRHFTRQIKDPKTGKMVNRPSRDKVEEINRERSFFDRQDMTIILQNRIDEFFDLPELAQRECLAGIRREIAHLRHDNIALEQSNTAYLNENIRLKNEIKDLKDKVKEYEHMKAQFKALTDTYTDKECRKMLSEEGVSSSGFDADKYKAFLEKEKKEPENVLDSLIIGEGVF